VDVVAGAAARGACFFAAFSRNPLRLLMYFQRAFVSSDDAFEAATSMGCISLLDVSRVLVSRPISVMMFMMEPMYSRFLADACSLRVRVSSAVSFCSAKRRRSSFWMMSGVAPRAASYAAIRAASGSNCCGVVVAGGAFDADVCMASGPGVASVIMGVDGVYCM